MCKFDNFGIKKIIQFMATNSKHPSGLKILFFTEMWERFGFYLMLGIFMLYMLHGKNEMFPGMGFSFEHASDIYGTYIALVYLTPFFGGLIADRLLGYRKSIIIGGLLMAAGYIGLAFYNDVIFFISLGLIILGNGFFKPNISSLVGKLYDNDTYRNKRDAGFNIFYMGINLGGFLCNFVAAYMRINYGWGWAFAAAGIGMIIGIIWFIFGQYYSKDIVKVDKIAPQENDGNDVFITVLKVFGLGILAAFIGWNLFPLIMGDPLLGSRSTDAFLFFSIVIIVYYLKLYKQEYSIAFREAKMHMSDEMADLSAKKSAESIKALLAVFLVVVVFWAVFHQNGSALTLWAERFTDRSISEQWVPVAETFSLNQTVSTEIGESPIINQHGLIELDANGKPLTADGPDEYYYNLPKEKWPENGKSKLISAEMFQSVNPFFIILFTPLLVMFFNYLKNRKKAISTPQKIVYGLIISTLSCVVMIVAVWASGNGDTKVSAWWLVSAYAVITIGEIFLSPMSLSLVSKLSPPRLTAIMMGGLFLSGAIGNKLSGILSGMWTLYENKTWFFALNMVLLMISVIMSILLLKWLNKVVKEKEENS